MTTHNVDKELLVSWQTPRYWDSYNEREYVRFEWPTSLHLTTQAGPLALKIMKIDKYINKYMSDHQKRHKIRTKTAKKSISSLIHELAPLTTLILARSLERCNSYKFLLIPPYVLLGHPQLLLPSTMILSIFLTRASIVFLYTYPNHFNLFSRNFVERGATPNFSLNFWFLILSIIVTNKI